VLEIVGACLSLTWLHSAGWLRDGESPLGHMLPAAAAAQADHAHSPTPQSREPELPSELNGATSLYSSIWGTQTAGRMGPRDGQKPHWG
jgi:hypothetical protein